MRKERQSPIVRYFFPPVTLKQQLPLLPAGYSIDSPEKVPPKLQQAVRLLKASSVAKTDADALRLIQLNPGLTAQQIADKRKRKRPSRWETFRRRWAALWD